MGIFTDFAGRIILGVCTGVASSWANGKFDDGLPELMYQKYEAASKIFFAKYGDEFGNSTTSFLAEEKT